MPGVNRGKSVEEMCMALRTPEHGDRPDHGPRQAQALAHGATII
jgi:hypothetical protein